MRSVPLVDGLRGRIRLVAASGLLVIATACATQVPPGVSPGPGQPWSPPKEIASAPPVAVTAPRTAGPALPSDPVPDQPVSLAALVDLGLARNPDTRQAWLAARAAAADVEIQKSGLYPQVDADVSAGRTRAPVGGSVVEKNSYGPGVAVSYLLLDFGGRSANIEQARQALIAADWQHNAAIADRVLAIAIAYRRHQAALALAEAQRTAVKLARTNLEAADARRQAGVATIADVLQARTALSRSELDLETNDGLIVTTRADLNNAVGLRANAPLTVEPLPASAELNAVRENVDALLEASIRRRPEVGAAEADVRRAEARIAAARSQGLPALGANATAGRTWFTDSSDAVNTYAVSLSLRFPVFTGFAQQNNVRRAEEELEVSRARLESARQQVELEVVKVYQAVLTTIERVRTSADLVASADKNAEVAQGRYRAGAGSILELLAAQRALEDARASEVQARADWLGALAAFARATGTTTVTSSAPARGNQP